LHDAQAEAISLLQQYQHSASFIPYISIIIIPFCRTLVQLFEDDGHLPLPTMDFDNRRLMHFLELLAGTCGPSNVEQLPGNGIIDATTRRNNLSLIKFFQTTVH
jgi:hypothetical protein